MKSIIKKFATDTDNFILNTIDSLAEKYLKVRNNLNYDIKNNGENWILNNVLTENFKTFFDVGANIGDWSLLVSQKYKNSSIHSFEIVPQTYSLLKANVKQCTNININCFGLSDRRGNVNVNFSPDDDKLSSLVAGHEIHDLVWNTVECKIITGDEYCSDNNINKIDFLKIDVEGADLKVIRGFSNTIRTEGIRLIQFEYGMANIYSRDLLYDHFEFLSSFGYVIGKLMPKRVDVKKNFGLSMKIFGARTMLPYINQMCI